MWDEVGFAAWLQPSLITHQERLAITVDTNPNGGHYGGTLSWAAGKGPGIGEPDVDVVREVDVKAFEELFAKMMGYVSPRSPIPGR
jgi:inosine-uridine nucleoside N-ribohydrolase